MQQITSNFHTQTSWRLYEIRQPPTSLCTTSNFLMVAMVIIVAMVNMVAMVMVIMVFIVVMLVMLVMVVVTVRVVMMVWTGQDRTVQDKTDI